MEQHNIELKGGFVVIVESEAMYGGWAKHRIMEVTQYTYLFQNVDTSVWIRVEKSHYHSIFTIREIIESY